MIYLFQKVIKVICVIGIVLVANLSVADVKPSASKAEDLMKGLLSFKYFRPNSNFLPTFIYNKLPRQINNIIKLPENSNLYGSLVNGDQVETVFSTTDTADEVKTYFKNVMKISGWYVPENHNPRRSFGFQSKIQYNNYFELCKKGESSYFRIRSNNVFQGKTTVIILYDTAIEASPCKRQLLNTPFPAVFNVNILPKLINPDGLKASNMHSGGGGNSYAMSVNLATTNVSMVMQHYSKQMKQQDWVMLEKLNKTSLSLSVWESKDESGTKWKGVILINKSNEDLMSTDIRLWIFNHKGRHRGRRGYRGLRAPGPPPPPVSN